MLKEISKKISPVLLQNASREVGVQRSAARRPLEAGTGQRPPCFAAIPVTRTPCSATACYQRGRDLWSRCPPGLILPPCARSPLPRGAASPTRAAGAPPNPMRCRFFALSLQLRVTLCKAALLEPAARWLPCSQGTRALRTRRGGDPAPRSRRGQSGGTCWGLCVVSPPSWAQEAQSGRECPATSCCAAALPGQVTAALGRSTPRKCRYVHAGVQCMYMSTVCMSNHRPGRGSQGGRTLQCMGNFCALWFYSYKTCAGLRSASRTLLLKMSCFSVPALVVLFSLIVPNSL